MSGATRIHRERGLGRAFPASCYDDPRGGRPSGLERNILRYRAAEAALYLCYAQEVRDFMMTDVHREASREQNRPTWEPSEVQRLQGLLSRLLMDAETQDKLSAVDADALRRAFANHRQQGKKLKAAFAYAIEIGMFTETEADELQELLEYRNDIAHRIHLVMSDVTRSYWVSNRLSSIGPTYQGDALHRLRAYRQSLRDRAKSRLCITIRFNVFELAELTYEAELKRLDPLIRKQIAREQQRLDAINAELDLRGTELVGDLAPRFPANHRFARSYGDDCMPATGHLTKRGEEICYRLYDHGKSPIAVAYLMGMGLRSAQRRRQGWLRAGGLQRKRYEVQRYDLAAWEKGRMTPL